MKIVIVGAGYAGVLTAKKLAKRCKKHRIYDVSIVLIDKNPFHTMLTELHEVAANRVDEESIKVDLKKVFAERNVDVKLDTVTSIDFKNRRVVGIDSAYGYDYLVLAAGSKPTYFGIPGADEYAFKLWSFDDAVKLKDHIHNVFRMAARETDIEKKRMLLHFNVVGAGYTGVEMVGELAEYVPILCEKYEIDRDMVTIRNVDILTRVCPGMPEKLSRKVEKRLAKMGVQTMMNTSVVSIGNGYIETKHNEVLSRAYTSTVIWAAGVESSTVTSEAAKTLPSAGRGRITVDPYLRSVADEAVFVGGDNIFFIPEGEKNPVPQVVENCEQSAHTIAHNLVCAMTGKGEMEKYKPSFHGIMVSVGGRYGIARVGTPRHMVNLPSFLAMFTKHFINIVYFVQVLGWNKVFSYLKHEFFTIRNRRSFVGGHFSNRTPSFLLFPLRVWLGAVWLFEGIQKIWAGWFTDPKLKDFFGGATAWFNSILAATNGTADTGKAADALTKATGAVEGAAVSTGVVIFNIPFFGLFHAIFVSGKQVIQSALGDLAFKLDVPLMNWFVDKVILPSNGVQIAMQIFIVVAEILVGLALIGGLFTSLASAFSLVLLFMFVCTTGLYLNTFWMIFAAIAMLIGAGRIFGLDYYVMPHLKRWWKRRRLARKSYLYHD